MITMDTGFGQQACHQLKGHDHGAWLTLSIYATTIMKTFCLAHECDEHG